MKTNTKSLMTLAAALAVSAWLPLSASAGGNGTARGGAADLMRRPTIVAGAVKETVMSCPMCKTEYALKTDISERGAFKPAKPVGKHLCGKCATDFRTIGVGKHAATIATHVCVACK